MNTSHDEFQFFSLYLTRFALSFGFITVLTLLPDYIEALGATGVTIGLLVTALETARTVGIVPVAWAGDRYNKRTVLLSTLFLTVFAYATFATISTVGGFLVARTLQGLGLAGAGLLSLAILSELVPDGHRGNYIGRYNSFRMAAGIAGTLGTGVLYSLTGFRVVFGIVAALVVVAAVGTWRFVDTDGTTIKGFAFTDLALNRRIMTITTFRAQYAVAVTLVRNWVPIFVGVSAAQGGLAYGSVVVGAVLAAEKFMNMLAQPLAGRFSDAQGRAMFVFIGGGAYGLLAIAFPFIATFEGLFVIEVPLFKNLTGVVVAAVCLNGLLGVADAFREPASMALFADEGKSKGIASSFGVRSLIWKPGSVLAPLLGGWLMGTAGINWVFFIGGFAALSGVITFFCVLSWNHGQHALSQW